MKKAVLLICLVVLFTLTAFAAEPSFEKGAYRVSESETVNYWLFTPANASENMPLIVYLHGGSGKGDNINILTENGFCQWVSEGTFNQTPAYIIFPQLSSAYNGWAGNKTNVRSLIMSIVKQYSIDKENISLVGHSMGGTGAFSLAAAYPTLFSRVMPMSGSITNNEKNISALSQLPVWAIVGSEDTIVSPDSSIEFVDALVKNGADAKITVLDGATHFTVPELAFLNNDLRVVDWLIGKSTVSIKTVMAAIDAVLNGGGDTSYDMNGDNKLSILDILCIIKELTK